MLRTESDNVPNCECKVEVSVTTALIHDRLIALVAVSSIKLPSRNIISINLKAVPVGELQFYTNMQFFFHFNDLELSRYYTKVVSWHCTTSQNTVDLQNL